MSVATTLHLRGYGLGIVTASLAAIAALTLTPEPPSASTPHLCLICGSFGTVDALLNVLLFVPLGVGLALSGRSARWSVLAMCALSVCIELAQLVIPGRDSTIGDVFFNTLGGWLGYILATLRFALLAPTSRSATKLAFTGTSAWLLAQAVFAFALSVRLTDRQYYIQIAHVLGGFSTFRGSVKDIGVDSLAMRDGIVDETQRLRASLLRGAPIQVSVVTRDRPPRIAPIVRIADAAREEIALVGQQGDAVVFAERTGASPLRLRSPFFAIDKALSRATARDRQVRILASRSTGAVNLQTNTELETKSVRIAVRNSLAWTLLLPSQWLVTGTPGETALGFLWTACVLLPLGFWWALSGLASRSLTKWVSSLTMAALAVGFGLTLVPKWAGISSASVGDWMAASAGLLAGAMLGLFSASRRPQAKPR